ncbi:MAG TPA: AAA family ATPase [Trueperaceae bacterium]
MRLVELRLIRLPGIYPGFDIDQFGTGVNVITGPNASGKSSIVRAVRALLYESELRGQNVHLEGVFEDGGERLEALRLGDAIRWSRNGSSADAPPLPDARFISCYTLRLEDLSGAAETDEEIASRLGRELSGGYDLRALLESEPFRVRPLLGRSEQRELSRADGEFRAARQQLAELHRREQDLDRLRRLKASAWAAHRKTEQLEKALELLSVRRRLTGNRQFLEALPQGLDLLRGDELERLGAAREAMIELELEKESAIAARKSAEAKLEASGLRGSELDEGDIREYRARLRRLRELESEAAQAAKERAKAAEAVYRAVDELRPQERTHGEEPPEVRLDPDTLTRVEQGLTVKRELDAKLLRLRSELAGLPPEASGPGVEALRSARNSLSTWLSADGRARWTGRRLLGLFLAMLAFAAALGATISAGPAALDRLPNDLAHAAPVVGYPLLAFLFLLGFYLMYLSTSGEKGASRKSFSRSGIEGPAAWNEAAVREALDLVTRELAAAEQALLVSQRRLVLSRELAATEEQLRDERTALARLAREVGFDPERLDSSFDRWLRLTLLVDTSRNRLNAATAEIEMLRGEIAPTRELITVFLARHGEAPGQEALDAQVLEARLEALELRLRLRDGAEQQLKTATAQITRLDEELRARQADVGRLFEAIGLAGLDESAAELELRDRLRCLSAWEDLIEKKRELELEDSRLTPLVKSEELLTYVVNDDEEGLHVELEARRVEAGRHEALTEEITKIETLVESAESERKLERLRADRQSAEDSLRVRYEEALLADAGTLLLEGVEQEHVASSRPDTLRRAEEWFRLFTRHRYELRFGGSSEPEFRALETVSGQERRLDELSTGTRAQLLLAVRVAYALQAEQGRRSLPLFLDEALTTADPDRFRAVTDSLRDLAAAGRQVFYLTARPADAFFWSDGDGSPAVRAIDIGVVRGRAEAVTEPGHLELPSALPVPTPGTASAEEYAVKLGVPAVDPLAPAATLHIFHLLRDDLQLLHDLLEHKIERMGSMRSFLRSGAASLLLTKNDQRDLALRIEAADAWFDGWRRGRGRPVDREALDSSGAVTAIFLDRADELARDLEGDAERLMAALADGVLRGFRESNKEQLAEWLLDHGYLDERETLDPAALRQHVAAQLSTRAGRVLSDDGLDLFALATEISNWLEAGVSSGGRGQAVD